MGFTVGLFEPDKDQVREGLNRSGFRHHDQICVHEAVEFSFRELSSQPAFVDKVQECEPVQRGEPIRPLVKGFKNEASLLLCQGKTALIGCHVGLLNGPNEGHTILPIMDEDLFGHIWIAALRSELSSMPSMCSKCISTTSDID